MANKEISELARKLGSIGGKKRAKTLSKARRSEIAKKAAAASAEVRTKKAKKKRAPGHEVE
jgi:hypothetical protein